MSLVSTGESLLTERVDSTKVAFDTEKSMCCFIEGNQTLVHGRGGRGYGAANVGFSSGEHDACLLHVSSIPLRVFLIVIV